MNIQSIKEKLQASSIFHSEGEIANNPSVVGYEKKFKWSWMATQLNTFIVATDYGSQEINESIIESHLSQSFAFAKNNYKGWPRGLQSGVGVISVLISSNLTEGAKEYCRKLKSGKKWAGFSIPVVVDAGTQEVFEFEKYPMWGRIYYPHFRKLINGLK
ncbi:hypothetical protein POV27_05630 [Aureisphaera galaxeae]|uniref:hypothetical protein n=1 Tax=Aureisphaera galaxeae TaxID=1538023 RepID=UPI0023507352|nr:hypothetical protein [Aureisphaera galaxeae]MDC8003521.1 hypothetical protein [Aureisphaera galaxeae]